MKYIYIRKIKNTYTYIYIHFLFLTAAKALFRGLGIKWTSGRSVDNGNEVDTVKCWDGVGKHLGCSKCRIPTAKC